MNLFTTQEQNKIKSIFTTAGKNLLKLRGAKRLASKNTGHATSDIVTQADIDTEKFLKYELGKAFPAIGFYSEESAKFSKKELEKERVWIADPIDGTLNFARGLPFFAVGCSLYAEGKPVVSCIYFPVFDELYWAVKNEGAYANNQRLTASVNPKPSEVLPILSHIHLTPNQQMHLYKLLAQKYFSPKGIGCSHFHAAHTAAGHYDMWIGINQALWDMAPGQTLISEAGGAFELIRVDEKNKAAGIPYHWWFIAGNPTLVKELTPELKKI